jgi:hypothetical protein
MPAGNIRRPSEALLRQWLKTARHYSSPESSAKRFKKCCVSNNINGKYNEVQWKEDQEENSSYSNKSLSCIFTNRLKAKSNVFYIRPQCVPFSKHPPPHL